MPCVQPYYQTYDRNGLPLGRERRSRIDKVVEKGAGELISVAELAARLNNLAGKAAAMAAKYNDEAIGYKNAQAGNVMAKEAAAKARKYSVMAAAYHATAKGKAMDAEAGAANDKVLWLYRSAKRESAKHGAENQRKRMKIRAETGEALWHLFHELGIEALNGRGQEYMFSSAGCDVEPEVWDQIASRHRVLRQK